MKSTVRALLLSAAVAAAVVSSARAQERNFTVTMSEARWNIIAKHMAKINAPWEEINPVMAEIGQQIGQQAQQYQRALGDTEKLRQENQRLQDELKRVIDAQQPAATPPPEPETPQ